MKSIYKFSSVEVLQIYEDFMHRPFSLFYLIRAPYNLTLSPNRREITRCVDQKLLDRFLASCPISTLQTLQALCAYILPSNEV